MENKAVERYWMIHYGCGCGDNEDFVIAKTEEEAMEIARENAIEDYESYEGLHGIRGMVEIAEEDFEVELDELEYDTGTYVEIEQVYFDERESSLDYWVQEVTYQQYLNGTIEEEDEESEEDE